MGTGFAKKKKQAKEMQAQLSQLQSQLENVEVTGSAGNGLVQVVLNGDHDLKRLKINPECVDREDIEGLEDLIKAAYQDANAQLKKQSDELSSKLPGGFPGLAGFGF